MDLSTTLTKREKLRLVRSIRGSLLTASCAILERQCFVRADMRKDSDGVLDQLHRLVSTLICVFDQMIDSVKRLPRTSSRKPIAKMHMELITLNHCRAVNDANALAEKQHEALPMPTIVFYISTLSLIKNVCYTYQNLIKVLDIEEPDLFTQGDVKDLLNCKGDLYYDSQQIAATIVFNTQHGSKVSLLS